MTKSKIFLFLISILVISLPAGAQWTPVLDDVVPGKIVLSPNYHQDQTVYVVDDEIRVWISETGGTNWTTVYEGSDPGDPEQAVLDIVISPNFTNDHSLIMIHKDGTVKLSPDRGQHWLTALTPDGVTGVSFSQRVADDYTMFCLTGIMGPVDFYKSVNWGASWGDPVAEITIGGGYYGKLWTSMDIMSRDTFAIHYEPLTLFMSHDGGETWLNSFTAQTLLSDFVFSPQYSKDSTVFVADAADIYKNPRKGNELYWVPRFNFPGAYGIKFAISPDFINDRTIFAAVDQAGIIRSTDYGETWSPFNEGFSSILPISVAISNVYPFTLFAGSVGEDGTPGKVWRYQSYTGTGDPGGNIVTPLAIRPNPVSDRAEITFETSARGFVRMEIYDISGRVLQVIVDELLDEGFHAVGLDNTGKQFKPGAYFCRLEAGGQVRTVKMIVTR